jgi:hypothetical protein
MFKSEKQICKAIRTLLKMVNKQHLWGLHGPNPEAFTATSEPFNLSTGEAVLLNVCWDLWRPVNRRAPLGDVVSTLDGQIQLAIADLLRASVEGPDAVDQWIKDRES